MRSSQFLAIDIGSARVVAGVFGASKGHFELEELAIEHRRIDLSANGGDDGVERVLTQLARRLKPGTRCRVGLPAPLALTRMVRIASGAGRRRKTMVAAEAAAVLPIPLGQLIWDYSVGADDGTAFDAMIVAVKADAIRSLCRRLEAKGLRVEAVTPVGVALRRAYLWANAASTEAVCVADMGARSVQLLFLAGDHYHLRALPFGADSAGNGVHGGAKFQPAAEDLMTTARNIPADATTTFVARLAAEIRRGAIRAAQEHGGAAPAKICVTGGGSLPPDLPSLLSSALELPVERFDPFLALSVTASTRREWETPGPVLTSLIGLAVAGSSRSMESDPDLLPLELRSRLTSASLAPWAIGTAAALTLAALPPVYYFQTRASTLRKAVEQADAVLAPLRAVEIRNDANLQRIEVASRQIAALQPAFQARTSWIGFLADLQERLGAVEDVWIDRLALERGRHSHEAVANPQMRAARETRPAAEEPVPRLVLSGRLLDPRNPRAKVSAESLARAKRLRASLLECNYISAVETERYDTTENGLLRFDFTLVTNPGRPL